MTHALSRASLRLAILIGMASRKRLPRMESWSLSLLRIIVEAMPIGIASDCCVASLLAMPRNDTFRAINASLCSLWFNFCNQLNT